MSQKLKDKVAVVTGSGAGIGRAIALAMAAEGAGVVVNDIDHAAVDKVVDEIKQAGGAAAANYDSVATMAGGENIIKTATDNFGRIDILVNNAGNFWRGRIIDMTEEIWDSIQGVHMKGLFACGKPAIMEMLKQKSGRIINMSSRAAFLSYEVAYCSAKAGILGATTALAMDLKDTGITVNAVMPGARTQLFPEEKTTHMPGVTPKLRLGPEWVPPIIVFLATDEAKDITGRFFHAAGHDMTIYPKLLRVPGGSPTALYNPGKWTVEELIETIPPLMGNG